MAKHNRLAEPLDVDNCHVWKPHMRHVLLVGDLWSAVTDGLVEETSTRESKGNAEEREKKSQSAQLQAA